MLYDEFIAGTGCRDTAKNYKVFKDLEILYMNSDLPKEQIYEYGKKLVDNSLTEEQVIWNDNIDRQITELKEALEIWKSDVARYESNRDWSKLHGWDDIDFWNKEIKQAKTQMKSIRWNIRQLKDCKYT